MGKRTIVIGDIHGCLDEFKMLLEKLSVSDSDRVICAGDYVDRGPDPAGVVRLARERRYEGVLGNHEEKHLRYAQHEAKKKVQPTYKNPMKFNDERRIQHESLTSDDKAYLAALPVYLRFQHNDKPWMVTHAGVPSNAPIEELDLKKVVRCRNTDSDTGEYASTGDPFEMASNSVYWVETWKGPESVVYGHIVQEGFRPLVRSPSRPEYKDIVTLGIDTGCCFGGQLTAAVFEDGRPWELVSVQALKTYAARRNMNAGD